MKIARIALSLCLAFTTLQAISAEKPSQPIKFELTGATMDGPNLAYLMMRSFMTDEEWQERVADCKRRFQTWEKDNGGDMGQFLNDRLVIVALGAAGGEIEEIQKGVAYLALYHEFRQPPPSLVLRFLKEHKETVSELLADFSWEKASEYVKTKGWREDIARRKSKARQSKETEEVKTTVAADTTVETKPVEVADAKPSKSTETKVSDQPEADRLPESTLKMMSLNWDTFTAPLTAETP